MSVELPVPQLPVPSPSPVTSTSYMRTPDRVDSSLIKSCLTALRRQCGDEAKQLMVKVLDPIPSNPTSADESGFTEIVPVIFTLYYAPKRKFSRPASTTTFRNGNGNEWLPREEWLKRKREEEDVLIQK